MHSREADLIAQRRICPDLARRYFEVGQQSPRAVNGRHGHVEMEIDLQLSKRDPLRHRLQVIHRLGRLDFDHADKLLRTLVREQHEVGKPRRLRWTNRGALLMSRVDGNVELPLVLGLQKANYPVVLELLAHGTHEDGAQ